MRNFDREPLTKREMRVYLCLLWEVKQAVTEAELLVKKVRAAEIIAAHEEVSST